MPRTLDVHCARLEIGNGIFIMHSLCAGIVSALAFPILASAASIVACIRIDHLNSSFAPLHQAHPVRRKKKNVASLKSIRRPAPLQRPTTSVSSVRRISVDHTTRRISHIRLLREFWSFHTKPNTQDCVRCPPSLLMSYGGRAEVLVRIPRLLLRRAVCHGGKRFCPFGPTAAILRLPPISKIVLQESLSLKQGE